MAPVVSVVTPFYKRVDLLKECIDSVCRQTYVDWQHILVNDGEEPQRDIMYFIAAHPFKEKITIIGRDRLPEGAPTCRNIGWQQAVGEYVLFLDSDDVLASSCLEQRVNVMISHPDLDFAVFPMLLFNNNIGDAEYLWNVTTEEEDVFRFLKTDAVWQTSGAIWKKSALEKISGFTEGLLCWQDVDIHLKALLANLRYQKFYHLSPDCYYRKHNEGSISQNKINSLEKLKSRFSIFESAITRVMHIIDNLKYLDSIREMALGTLVSAIKSIQIRFFFRMLMSKHVWVLLDWRHKSNLFIDVFFYSCRLFKLPLIGRNYVARSQKYLTSSCIGKFKWISP